MQDQPQMPPSYFEQPAQHSRIEKQYKQLALTSMQYLDGWCSETKASDLMDLVWFVKPKVIVEIGVFGGKSLVPMAFALKATGAGKAYGIDPWSAQASAEGMDGANKEWWGNLDHEAILRTLQERVKQFDLEEYVQLVQATSEAAAPIEEIDILHIDGNHSEGASFLDVEKWVPYVRQGGIIIFDDIGWTDASGGTSKAVDWLDAHYMRLRTVEDVENEWGIWIKS